MRSRHSAFLLSAIALCAPFPASAQSTDGFHASQVIPVVVDTASFKSRLTFTNPLNSARTIRAYYIPTEGTSQAQELDCGTFNLSAGQVRTFASLRDLCTALPAGSQFGALHTMIANPEAMTGLYSYGAYARVDNPQGLGFSVEGFPAHTFTGASVSVSGLRRLAATASSPAYQTNCFVGSLHNNLPNNFSTGTVIEYDVLNAAGAVVATQELQVPLGKMVRVLDIFAHAGLPAGDYDDMQVLFWRGGTPAVSAFCTVQDNTSFSADFRIGKQYLGNSLQENGSTLFAQDDHVVRRTQTAANIALRASNESLESAPFVLAAGDKNNAHVIQFRHPDWVACDVLSPIVQNMLLDSLEIRLSRGSQVIAGGNNVNSFAPVYLGDKYDQLNSNTRYVLEVESADPALASDTPYLIRCRSGSGHTAPTLVRAGAPGLY